MIARTLISAILGLTAFSPIKLPTITARPLYVVTACNSQGLACITKTDTTENAAFSDERTLYDSGFSFVSVKAKIGH